MPIYSYTFRDQSGGTQKGTAEAESEEILRKRFEEQGFTITEVTVIKGGKVRGKRYGKVKLANLAIFCRQFSTMVDAGVSLVRCLDVLSRQTQDPKLKKILMDIGERVEGGESLSRAMQRHPRSFNNLFIGLIRAGEVGGVLEESLQRLSHFLEKDVELRRKVKAALTYPVLVMIAAIGSSPDAAFSAEYPRTAWRYCTSTRNRENMTANTTKRLTDPAARPRSAKTRTSTRG